MVVINQLKNKCLNIWRDWQQLPIFRKKNRIAYDKALDRYRVNQIVEEDERRKNEEMRRKAAEEGMKEGLKGRDKRRNKGRNGERDGERRAKEAN